MNYYKHHIGDYDSATAHLSMVEDAAYSRLLRLYYRKEKPISPDIAFVCRLVRAVSDEEREAVRAVLREFFEETPDGWRHARCDRELAEAAEIAERNRENGRRGGRPRGNHDDGKPSGLFLGSQTEPKANPDVTQPIVGPLSSGNLSHKPLATSHKPEEANKSEDLFVASKLAPCPHQEIIEAYHTELPSLARVREWTTERQALLRKRWAEKPDRQNLDWWRNFFRYVGESDFLMGRCETKHGAFEADLEWLIRPKNFVKVIEGRYQNRQGQHA